LMAVAKKRELCMKDWAISLTSCFGCVRELIF
jgi:hypothetical protein